ncbi:MAG TPA: Rieske 2Fe-2S domain-containing protein, partial [Acidimicrobiia bacterium]|nr:Rieske 2Fe-2S domain-containing protein [Acidimicrobiia bacterium]
MWVASAALAPGVVVAVEIGRADYVVWRGYSGKLGSAPRSCPHLDHDLAAGFVVGDKLVCPGHAWAFDGHGRVHKRNEYGRVDPKGQVPALTLREHGDGIEVEPYSRPLMSTTYPPDRHLLRDLRLTFEHSGGHDGGHDHRTSRAWMPIVAELLASDGTVRAGALATLVDVIGGGLAATVAHPNWIATADLTLHLAGAATHGSVEARARVAHAGRTTVVIEVDLHDHTGRAIG